MKKYLIISLILLVFMSFALIGCEGEISGVDSQIARLEIHPNSPKTFDSEGDIDLSQIRIIATYKDGSEEIIQLSDAMLSDDEREKFTTVAASHTIRIEYKGKAVLYNFAVTESIPQTKYDVHFESNGGTNVESQHTNVVESFTIPIRAGYTFIGWFNNVDLQGAKAEAPYPIYEDTTFYADWEDNRKWTVSFLDIEGNPIPGYSQTIVHESDVPYLPEAPEVEGYIFQRWQGPIYNVTENIEVESVYERIYFEINVYSDETMNIRESSNRIPYGDSYATSNLPEVPEIEGYTGEWRIFTEYGLVDIEDQLERITDDYTIVPHYEIIKFTLTFRDDSAFEGTGESWPNIIRQVDYGSNFNLLEAGNPNITSPEERTGHIAQWAVLLDGVWINIDDGSSWDEEEKVWIEAGEPISRIDILNDDLDIIASISNGYLIENIKSNIQLQAKYQREQYNLIFMRGEDDLYTVQNINYNTVYSLYQPEGEPDPEVYYDEFTKQDFVMYNSLNDWDIEWYTNSEFLEEDRVEFPITVEGNMTFICDDIDLRTYEVQFYDWDFVNEEAVLLSTPIEIDGDMQNVETQIVSHGNYATPPTVNNKVEYGYDFRDSNNLWFDAPHDKADYAKRIYPNEIVKDTKFYVNYTVRTYNIAFRDYNYPYDDNGNADDFTVLENPPEVTYETDGKGHVYMDAIFVREHGHWFTDDEVYFGGDEIYQKIRFVEQYEADETLYSDLWSQYDNIVNDVDYYSNLVNNYNDYEQAILNYQTDDERWDGYQQPDYDTYMSYRDSLYDAEQKLIFINDYKIRPGESETGDRERVYNNIKIDNADDYQRMLNLFYEIEGREGYEFDGWFTNPNFDADTRVSENIGEEIVTEFEVDTNIVLYAKWIDLVKGSDGLVFEKVEEPNPEYQPENGEPEFLYYYQVIDYIDISEIDAYSEIEIGGEEYYRFTDPLTNQTREVSKNMMSFNDISQIQETELRIPASHHGLPVKKIREGSLGKNGDIIERVSIPNNIEIIDESVFAPCYELTAFNLSEENENFVLSRGVLYTADESVLICYPSKLEIEEYEYNTSVVPSTTYVIPADVTRIAKGAFSNVTGLKHIAFELGVLADELVIGEEAFMGCNNLVRVGMITPHDTENKYIADSYLPDRLVEIGARAFSGCLNIDDFDATLNSQLIYVGADAFDATAWFFMLESGLKDTRYVDGATDAEGIITIGYVVLGVANNYEGDILTLHAYYTKAVADKAFETKDFRRVIIQNSQFKHIGDDAFRSMQNLNRVDIYVIDPSTITLGTGVFDSSGVLYIYVPQGSVAMYETEEGWERYSGQYQEMEE